MGAHTRRQSHASRLEGEPERQRDPRRPEGDRVAQGRRPGPVAHAVHAALRDVHQEPAATFHVKRSPLPPRRKPLARSRKRIARATKRIARESDKTRRQRPTRRRALAIVAARDGVRCAAVGRIPHGHVCGGPLDGHELISRGRWPGGHLVPANIILVCRVAHCWIDDHPVEAVERGLLAHSWDR